MNIQYFMNIFIIYYEVVYKIVFNPRAEFNK